MARDAFAARRRICRADPTSLELRRAREQARRSPQGEDGKSNAGRMSVRNAGLGSRRPHANAGQTAARPEVRARHARGDLVRPRADRSVRRTTPRAASRRRLTTGLSFRGGGRRKTSASCSRVEAGAEVTSVAATYGIRRNVLRRVTPPLLSLPLSPLPSICHEPSESLRPTVAAGRERSCEERASPFRRRLLRRLEPARRLRRHCPPLRDPAD